MQKFSKNEVLDLYKSHPSQEKAILERVLENRGTLAGITELDLAGDSSCVSTDQNHVGGASFVESLAELACINAQSRVLDLACGLGGSARLLAHRFRCKVHGIDFSDERFQQALRLTRIVNLDNHVTFQCGDILSVNVPEPIYDVIWGQSAWTHVERKGDLINRWSEALLDEGRFAFEDSYLRSKDCSSNRLVIDLQAYWKSYIVGPDDWQDIFERRNFVVEFFEDLSRPCHEYFKGLLVWCDSKYKSGSGSSALEHEIRSWRLADVLLGEGILGYFRMIARRK